MSRLPRLALAVLPGLDHFVPGLLRGLCQGGRIEPKLFYVHGSAEVAAMLAWADRPETDAVWFEFCWPPFPALIAATDFAGRRVVVRVHRIEAYGTGHVADADWSRVSDVVVVGHDMAARVRAAAPEIDLLCRLHVIHNGIDLARFSALERFDRFRLGWCGWFSLHKNPTLALEILHRLRGADSRYRLHVSSKGGEPVAIDAFGFLAHRLGLEDAIHLDGAIGPDGMPAWHVQNGVLLSTSVYESFGYAIGEAAACGCDIAMLDHTAAAEFWPDAARFGSVDEAVKIVSEAKPHRWRGLIQERFSLERQLGRITGMLLGQSLTENACNGGTDQTGLELPASSWPVQTGDPQHQKPDRRPDFVSAAYWEQRYRHGGNSGAGSYGRLARFKASVLNALVEEHKVESVLEFGCGDGAQLSLTNYKAYVGVDVSATALAQCRVRFAGDASKRFVLPAEVDGLQADLALSLDVLFHLVEDDVFEAYMRRLFAAARRYVVIYASDRDAATADAHVRHRAFSKWIAAHAPGWQRSRHITNPYPFEPSRPNETSFADFFVFEPVPTAQNAGSGPAPCPAFQAA